MYSCCLLAIDLGQQLASVYPVIFALLSVTQQKWRFRGNQDVPKDPSCVHGPSFARMGPQIVLLQNPFLLHFTLFAKRGNIEQKQPS